MAADELRRHNLSAVLHRLHISGPLSRSTLARRTGLNRSTIADLIGELDGLGLVEEGPGNANTGPGRPSTVAQTSPLGAVVLAAELSVDSIAVATIGLGAHVYNQIRVATARRSSSPEETVRDVAKLASTLVSSLPGDHALAGVGVAVAGLVRRSDGFVHLAPNLGWVDVPLGEILGIELGSRRVMMANEADLGALAEYRRGSAAEARNMIYVAGEVGIGTGIIQEGNPMLGMAGYAGEAGHMMINPQGRQCRCGSVGCWETEAGEDALARIAGLGGSMVGQSLIDQVVSRAEEGDRAVQDALEEIGHWLGLGIGNLINIFNPDVVVVGGFYHELYRFLEDSVLKSVAKASLDAPREIATIRRSTLGIDAALMGAAELVLSEVIASPATFTASTLTPAPESL